MLDYQSFFSPKNDDATQIAHRNSFSVATSAILWTCTAYRWVEVSRQHLQIFFFIRRKKCTHNTETKQRTIIAMVYVNKCFNCLLLRIYRMNQRRLIRTRMSKIARTKLNWLFRQTFVIRLVSSRPSTRRITRSNLHTMPTRRSDESATNRARSTIRWTPVKRSHFSKPNSAHLHDLPKPKRPRTMRAPSQRKRPIRRRVQRISCDALTQWHRKSQSKVRRVSRAHLITRRKSSSSIQRAMQKQ